MSLCSDLSDDFSLVYFKVNDCVSIVKGQEVVSVKRLEAGSKCKVKEKGKVHSGCVVTYDECIVTLCVHATIAYK